MVPTTGQDLEVVDFILGIGVASLQRADVFPELVQIELVEGNFAQHVRLVDLQLGDLEHEVENVGREKTEAVVIAPFLACHECGF